jgi:hypothetical protein
LRLDSTVVALAAGLVVLRLGGKIVGCVPLWLVREPGARGALMGAGLLSQGGIAMVIAIDFGLLYRNDLANAMFYQTLVSAVLVAVLLNEALSPIGLRLVLPGKLR